MNEPRRKPTREEEEWCRAFERELRMVKEAGIPIYLDGKAEDLRTIAEACMVRDNGPYSCRYATGEDGLELCFLREETPARETSEKEARLIPWFWRLLGQEDR